MAGSAYGLHAGERWTSNAAHSLFRLYLYNTMLCCLWHYDNFKTQSNTIPIASPYYHWLILWLTNSSADWLSVEYFYQ